MSQEESGHMKLNLSLAKFTLTLNLSTEVKVILKSVFVGVLCYLTACLGWLWDRLVPFGALLSFEMTFKAAQVL